MDLKSKDHPKNLIPRLCKQFYQLGWVTGTGGGISIKHQNKIYVAPSGVQKEFLESDDIFVLDEKGRTVEAPLPKKKLKLSQCLPLFMCIYNQRIMTNAVIHSHSKHAVLATLVWPGKTITLTHLEMMKGIWNDVKKCWYRNDEKLVIPIIENTPCEEDLKDTLQKAIAEYPETQAVLVRRHGIYVWGNSWQGAKTMAECYDYLLDIAIRMQQFGINPMSTSNDYELNLQNVIKTESTYADEGSDN